MRDEVDIPGHISASVVPLQTPWSIDQDNDESLANLKATLLAKLMQSVGKDPTMATERDWFIAAALTVRDRIVHRWLASERESHGQGRKRVYYLSLEFLIGRLLYDVLENLGCYELFRDAFGDLGIDLARLRAAEPDAALGNGGLGRLAACFMESMATLGIPAYGYGIRYDHGLFRQVITDGVQQEYPEDWLSFGNPWEFARPEVIYDIQFGGWVETLADKRGNHRAVWHSAETIEAIAYDVPIVGWRGKRVNPLRLWSARAVDPMRLDTFNRGDHTGALAQQVRAEAISKILYPSDESDAGQELRLRQEYFFVSASLQDLVARHIESYGDIHSLPDRASIQLNDTHPSLAVPELMRILIDLHRMPWHEAWAITVATLSYTNHTLLPEALESWPVPLFSRLLPRHLQIIYLINEQHLKASQQQRPNDAGFLASVSLIDEHNGRRVRMGHLAFLGSHRVNGVSALHTDLMRKTVFRDLHALHPDRIVNKTNGIDFRRWLHQSNPRLTQLLKAACGDDILDDPKGLERLLPQLDDTALQEKFMAAKRANKLALSRVIRDQFNLRVDPAALFDVQVKRIHEYKRQLLNLLETIALYNAIRAQPHRPWVPRVKIFAGKAAASYAQAKLIIRLTHDVAKAVNRDPLVSNLLKIVFLPNYNVSLAESIMPAADLSEQISTAGMEASGTGNMKLSLNGAITIGTLDGANVEIRNHVGDDNIFIFGLRADEVAQRWAQGWDPQSAIVASPELPQVLDAIEQGVFSPDDPHRYRPLVDSLRYGDHYMIAADFDSYYDTQRKVDDLWRSPKAWARMAMINTAKMAWFSSDRSIAEYAAEIWKVPFDAVKRP